MRLIAVAFALGAAPQPAAAEDWPTRPITLVVSFPAGGSMDYLGRSIAQNLTEVFGQPVIVENRLGGGGAVATMAVARAPADGYTLLVTAIGPVVFRPIMEQAVGYDMDKEFTPVILAADSPNVLLASPKLGLNTVKDLLAYAKQKQNKLSIAHSGPGTMGHLCAVLFASEAHIDGSFIAYRGAPQMVTDLLGGQIDIGFPAFGPGSQSAKILAVTTAERVDFLPDVPTMKESGFDLVGSTWNAIYAPANVPPEIVSKLNRAIDAHLRKPETRQQLLKIGMRALGGTSEQLRERVKQDRANWSKILVGLKLDPDK
ncbi:MAG: tripartite tricarboxylate transporter substrate binding protein [Rhizobiales bacterium]|nr:tripartite tricarboxylate transporter substrate binding protein [Hyphomicrobiales bacterium]